MIIGSNYYEMACEYLGDIARRGGWNRTKALVILHALGMSKTAAFVYPEFTRGICKRLAGMGFAELVETMEDTEWDPWDYWTHGFGGYRKALPGDPETPLDIWNEEHTWRLFCLQPAKSVKKNT